MVRHALTHACTHAGYTWSICIVRQQLADQLERAGVEKDAVQNSLAEHAARSFELQRELDDASTQISRAQAHLDRSQHSIEQLTAESQPEYFLP